VQSTRFRPGDLRTRRIALGPGVVRISEVRSVDRWIDRLRPEEVADERLPYFGELWPAGLALARRLWREGTLEGRDVLDLGCGVGVVGLAASMRGARVVFADIFEEALDLACANARAAGHSNCEALRLDWRDPGFERTFDVVAGADLYYEARHHEPLIGFLERAIRPGGFALLSDPCRPNADPFFEEAARRFEAGAETGEIEHGSVRVPVRIVRLTPRAPAP